jgi:hypothetical protein
VPADTLANASYGYRRDVLWVVSNGRRVKPAKASSRWETLDVPAVVRREVESLLARRTHLTRHEESNE